MERAAELKFGTLADLEANLEAAIPLEEEHACNGFVGGEGEKLLRNEVVVEDIANVPVLQTECWIQRRTRCWPWKISSGSKLWDMKRLSRW